MSNRILKRILALGGAAANAAKSAAGEAGKTLKSFPAHNKVGLGLGATSLGLGLLNFKNNSDRMSTQERQIELEQKSLTALQKIHNAVKAKAD